MGVQITIRSKDLRFSSWDVMEGFFPDISPKANYSEKSIVRLVRKKRRGLFANRVLLRLYTSEGWVDLISVPAFLCKGRFKRSFYNFLNTVNAEIQSMAPKPPL